MARRDHGAAAETLEEIEGAADRLGDWLQQNITVVAVGLAVLLIAAGAGSWLVSYQRGQEQEASLELAKTREDFLSAMGAGPGTLEVPELANPEAAAQIRSEYQARFGEIADQHAGTVAGALAGIESAGLASQAGRTEEATQRLEQALADSPGGAVRGMVLQRLAQRLEAAERWSEAAERHEQAAALGEYPLRGWALADAARCRALAGEDAAALALYDRLEREQPDLRLPNHLKSQHLALRAAAAGS